jgi:hypothetical protein
MAMTAGTVSVADDGDVTKSGMAEALYDALLASEQAKAIVNGVDFPTGEDAVPALRAVAGLANAQATALVAYMQANAKAIIPTSAGGAGLQRTPDPNDPSTATLAPAAEKELGIL